MAEQAAAKPSTPYMSQDPEADLRRFKDTLRAVVQVPKECVEAAIEDEKRERKLKKVQVKDG